MADRIGLTVPVAPGRLRYRLKMECRVVVVEEYRELRATMLSVLLDHDVLACSSGYVDALEAVERCQPAVVVVDLGHVESRRGLDLVAEIRRRRPLTRLVTTSGLAHHRLPDDATPHLTKPFTAEALAAALRTELGV